MMAVDFVLRNLWGGGGTVKTVGLWFGTACLFADSLNLTFLPLKPLVTPLFNWKSLPVQIPYFGS